MLKVLTLVIACATAACGYKSLTDVECFKDGAKAIFEKHLPRIQAYDFVTDLKAFQSDHFMTVVRYCLGPDGSTSSTDFMQCLGKFNKCQVNDMENINWQNCVCSTTMCTMRNCLQTWLEEGGITAFACAAPCVCKLRHCLGFHLGLQH